MFSWSGGTFTALLEKATSTQLLEPDWMIIMELCDSVRSGETEAKGALSAVKKKLTSKNPNVTMLALHCLESMVKNCGHSIHKEIATEQFMEDFKDLLQQHESETVREKVLELIQTWAHAFRKEPAYRVVQLTMQFMRAVEGVKFPQLKESDAMFAAQVPPEWEDSDCCHLCRTNFSTFLRKHHCRNCGQVFCGKCSSQTAALPKLGIEKKVRVCDTCFADASPESPTHSSPSQRQTITVGAVQKKSPTNTTQDKASKEAKLKEAQLREEEELQLAIALSQSEAEYNQGKPEIGRKLEDRSRNTSLSSAVDYPPTEFSEYEANAPTRSECESTTGSTDAELSHYLDRKYWDERSNRVEDTETPKPTSRPIEVMPPAASEDTDQFEQNLEKNLETFVNRLRSNEMRGRPIANDTYVQSLFVQISSLHAKLLQSIQETDEQRVYYESLQDKIQQIRDARAALDALRDEHREEERKRRDESERARQLQMAHKLEIMRQRKQESIQYQHHLAMMRMQEQELQYRIGGAPPMMPPMSMAPSQLPGQPPVYVPQPQYPTVLPVEGDTSTPYVQNGSVPLYPPSYYPTSSLPPHMTSQPVHQMIPVEHHQMNHQYAQPVPQTPSHVPNGQPSMTSTVVPHIPGSGQPAFEPYNVSQLMAQLPQPPQTPLPQPCAPPQTPTPLQDTINLPSVPTHQPGAPVVHEAQLISFD